MKKKNSAPTPHAATFRQFLTQPDIARDFLALHLTPELRECGDLGTLKLESGSFAEDDFRQYFSDVLYSLKTMAGNGYIHVLIEHQSSPDKHMAFRLMRYAVAAMQPHLETGHKRLPLVIPITWADALAILIRPDGWMSSTPRCWRPGFTATVFRWPMSRRFMTMRSCNTTAWRH